MGDASNGVLLDRAEEAGYEVMITADKNMPNQQNMGSRSFALIVLGANRWPLIEPRVDDIRAALDGIQPRRGARSPHTHERRGIT